MNRRGFACGGAVVLSLSGLLVLCGCGKEETPTIPITLSERTAAVDNNPKLSSEQKNAQKQFIAEQERQKQAMMKAMGTQSGGTKP